MLAYGALPFWSPGLPNLWTLVLGIPLDPGPKVSNGYCFTESNVSQTAVFVRIPVFRGDMSVSVEFKVGDRAGISGWVGGLRLVPQIIALLVPFVIAARMLLKALFSPGLECSHGEVLSTYRDSSDPR